MSDTLQDCVDVLAEAGFSARRIEIPCEGDSRTFETLSFEDPTVIGFIVAYDNPEQLIACWASDRDRIAMRHRDVLKAAHQKAWNAYLILLARGPADFVQSLALGQIEENLEAMRKITKAGVAVDGGARMALLPLLPFRASPTLDPIEMRREIQSRSTELDEQIVAAFLSTAEEGVVMQLLEDKA